MCHPNMRQKAFKSVGKGQDSNKHVSLLQAAAMQHAMATAGHLPSSLGSHPCPHPALHLSHPHLHPPHPTPPQFLTRCPTAPTLRASWDRTGVAPRSPRPPLRLPPSPLAPPPCTWATPPPARETSRPASPCPPSGASTPPGTTGASAATAVKTREVLEGVEGEVTCLLSTLG